MLLQSRMLAAQYDAPLRGYKTRPSMPSAYVIPSENPRKGLRWGTRVRRACVNMRALCVPDRADGAGFAVIRLR